MNSFFIFFPCKNTVQPSRRCHRGVTPSLKSETFSRKNSCHPYIWPLVSFRNGTKVLRVLAVFAANCSQCPELPARRAQSWLRGFPSQASAGRSPCTAPGSSPALAVFPSGGSAQFLNVQMRGAGLPSRRDTRGTLRAFLCPQPLPRLASVNMKLTLH